MKAQESCAFLRDYAFRPDMEFGINVGWQEDRSEAGGCGIRIRSLIFDRNKQCAASSVIRRRA
jgi:hypothetical protein